MNLVVVLSHFAIVLVGLLVYAIGTHASGQRRHPSAALAWVLTITLMPYAGLPLYILLGTRKFVRPARHAIPSLRQAQSGDGLSAYAVATVVAMGLKPPQANANVQFHANGQVAWNELVALVNGARLELDICTYVLGNDSFGQRLTHLLAERASAGVRVRLLLDAVGSWRTPRAQIRDLRAAGVQVAWYMPLLFNLLRGRGNLRNHRKLAVADSQHLWSGGRNLAAEYFTGERHKQAWLDLSFTLEGPLAAQAQSLFDSHWRHSHGPEFAGKDEALKALTASVPLAAAKPAQHLAQMVPSGPDQADDTVYDLLLATLFRAECRVLAVTPYFVPDECLLTALCMAARRGVQVELVLPAHSNHRLADIARARALRDLAAAGARVRLAPGMVHAKAVVVDDAMALCGSLNLDSRSLFLNFELMVAFYAAEDISAITRWWDENFHDLPCYRPRQPSLVRDVAEGLVRWLGFQI